MFTWYTLKGDQLYTKLLLEEEELNMDLVWQVIDWYKQSVIRTREVIFIFICYAALLVRPPCRKLEGTIVFVDVCLSEVVSK